MAAFERDIIRVELDVADLDSADQGEGEEDAVDYVLPPCGCGAAGQRVTASQIADGQRIWRCKRCKYTTKVRVGPVEKGAALFFAGRFLESCDAYAEAPDDENFDFNVFEALNEWSKEACGSILPPASSLLEGRPENALARYAELTGGGAANGGAHSNEFWFCSALMEQRCVAEECERAKALEAAAAYEKEAVEKERECAAAVKKVAETHAAEERARVAVAAKAASEKHQAYVMSLGKTAPGKRLKAVRKKLRQIRDIRAKQEMLDKAQLGATTSKKVQLVLIDEDQKTKLQREPALLEEEIILRELLQV